MGSEDLEHSGDERLTGNREGTGFQYAGRRELPLQDRRTLRWRSLGLWLLGSGLLLVGLLLLFAALATGVFIEEAAGVTRIGLILVTVLLIGIIIGLVIAARVFLSESRLLGRDAREGWVDHYSGILEAQEIGLPSLDALVRLGLLAEHPDRVQSLEILPRSGLLWRANGTRPRRWMSVAPPRLTDIVAPPPYARIAAEWVEPTRIEGETVYLGHRELTEEELQELRRIIRRLIWKPLRIALPLTLWFGGVLALCVTYHRYPAGINLFFFVQLGLITVISDLVLAAQLGEVRLYRADARVGQVSIVRFAQSDVKTPPGKPELSEAVEVLPISGATWTVDGEPAIWRESL